MTISDEKRREVAENLRNLTIFECSKCGERWELTCGGPADNHLNFCPRCGAEVVS